MVTRNLGTYGKAASQSDLCSHPVLTENKAIRKQEGWNVRNIYGVFFIITLTRIKDC